MWQEYDSDWSETIPLPNTSRSSSSADWCLGSAKHTPYKLAGAKTFCFDLDLLSCDCSRLVAGPDDMMRPSCGTIDSYHSVTVWTKLGNFEERTWERDNWNRAFDGLNLSSMLPKSSSFPSSRLRFSLISSNSSFLETRHWWCWCH